MLVPVDVSRLPLLSPLLVRTCAAAPLDPPVLLLLLSRLVPLRCLVAAVFLLPLHLRVLLFSSVVLLLPLHLTSTMRQQSRG